MIIEPTKELEQIVTTVSSSKTNVLTEPAKILEWMLATLPSSEAMYFLFDDVKGQSGINYIKGKTVYDDVMIEKYNCTYEKTISKYGTKRQMYKNV